MARASPEASLQRSVFDWLRHVGVPGLIFFHVPNGLVSNPRAVCRMKREGLTSGVPDICLVRPGGTAAFLELKSPTGRQTPAQRAFQQLCESNGTPYAIARTIDEAIKALSSWGCIKKVGIA
jgi:VRR-NUC domain-containing protein